MLEVDEDSRLGAEVLALGKRYGAAEVPDEDSIAAFYEMAVERLASMGIARYEISNFARRGYESRHNLKYWRREPYVGFGADAHSFDGGTAPAECGNGGGIRGAVREREPFAVEKRGAAGRRVVCWVCGWRRHAEAGTGAGTKTRCGGLKPTGWCSGGKSGAADRPRRAAFERSFRGVR